MLVIISLLPWLLGALCYWAEGLDGLKAFMFAWFAFGPVLILIAAVFFDDRMRREP